MSLMVNSNLKGGAFNAKKHNRVLRNYKYDVSRGTRFISLW